MQSSSVQTIASFTGTLLRRQHTLGQKVVKLLFRENDKNVLCISDNPKDSALLIGQTYHVEGVFCEKKGRTFIQNARITQLKKHWSLVKRVVVCAVVLGGIAALGGTAFALHRDAIPELSVHTAPVVKATLPQAIVPASTAPQQSAQAASTPVPVVSVATSTAKKAISKPAVQTQTVSTSPGVSSDAATDIPPPVQTDQQPTPAVVDTPLAASSGSGSGAGDNISSPPTDNPSGDTTTATDPATGIPLQP